HLIDLGWRQRGRVLVHGGRAAREDDRRRSELGEARGADIVRQDLAIDPALPHPPRDELGHLAAEIEDEDFLCHSRAPSLSETPVSATLARRSQMATKNPSVPCFAGVSRSVSPEAGILPPTVARHTS